MPTKFRTSMSRRLGLGQLDIGPGTKQSGYGAFAPLKNKIMRFNLNRSSKVIPLLKLKLD